MLNLKDLLINLAGTFKYNHLNAVNFGWGLWENRGLSMHLKKGIFLFLVGTLVILEKQTNNLKDIIVEPKAMRKKLISYIKNL